MTGRKCDLNGSLWTFPVICCAKHLDDSSKRIWIRTFYFPMPCDDCLGVFNPGQEDFDGDNAGYAGAIMAGCNVDVEYPQQMPCVSFA